MTDHTARAKVAVQASPEEVWQGLTSPDLVRIWMSGAQIAGDWTPGGTVTWSGVWDGQPFEDSGTVLEVEVPRRLSMTHRSGGSARADTPDDQHVVTYDLVPDDGMTVLTVTQDSNPDPASAAEYQKTWALMLLKLKEVVEQRRSA